MFPSKFSTIGIDIAGSWLAQVQVAPGTTATSAEAAALVFSGPQFFTALVAGVLLAFAFQLLLTNLGVAAGISFAGGKSSHKSDDHHDSDGLGSTIRKVGTTVGLLTLISVVISLFCAALFAVRLSLLVAPVSGAIVGLVIWATYFTLLVWFSSTTVGSFIGSIVNTATSSMQALMGTVGAVIGGKAANRQVVATAEAAAAAIRRELGSAIDPVTLRENLQDYLDTLRPPQLDLQRIGTDLENILRDPNLQDVVDSENLQHIDRQTFIDLISSRSDLSQREVEQLAARLEAVWQKTTKQQPKKNPLSEFGDYLKSATREQLLGSEMSGKLDSLLDEMRKRRQSDHPGAMSQAMTLGLNSIVGMLMGRTDLSDFDIEKVVGQLNKLKGQVGEQKDKITARLSGDTTDTYSTVRADIENYLLNAYTWQLQPENLNREFRDLLYDPEADPDAVATELEQISRSDFVNLLEQKGVFTRDKIQATANILDAIRLEVLHMARATAERGKAMAVLSGVENYLLTAPKEELLAPEKIQLNFRPILEDPDADFDHLSNRLAQLDNILLERLLQQRGDLTPVEVSTIIGQLQTARDRVVAEARDVQSNIKIKSEQQWLRVQSYLRDTGKAELNPDAIERELKLLLDDPQAGASALRTRAAHFDRDTLVKLLSQRQDLSEEQVNQIIDRVEANWTRIRYAPQRLAGKAKEQYDKVSTSIADYLRNTGKEELNPEGIQRDLNLLLNDPKAGAQAIRYRLRGMDRDTLVQLLSQRQDLSEQQVNEIIDEVQATLDKFAKAPRRLARRTQQKVQDFQSAIADYLRSTDRAELSPAGIERDIKLLLNDPRTGAASLKERLAHFDRDTLIALLSQRKDISEEDARRIVNNILLVRDQFIIQLQSIQNRIQSVIDGIFLQIRDYLNSLERPELNYEGIKTDLRTLFDDPQAGFDALRDRFSQLDRDTLVALLSSRPDISKADADRIISQVERTRDRMLQRAERIQQQAQLRVEQVKAETQRQVEETRKAAATAAWWLFFIALTSALAAAGGGALGVID